MIKHTKTTKKGFTLIELLVVVAIIAILALTVLLALNPVEMAKRSRDSRRLSDLGTLRRAIDLSLADGKSLPTVASGGIALTSTDPTSLGGTGLDVSKYVSVVPVDPSYTVAATTTDACATPQTTTSRAVNAMVYRFKTNSTTGTYQLESFLESTDNCAILGQDGNTDSKYEIGTQPNLNLP